MIALHFEKINDISTNLFAKDTFDNFLLREASLVADYALTLENTGQAISYGKVRALLSTFVQNSSADSPALPKGHIVLCAPLSYQVSLMEHASFSGDPDIIKGLILTFRFDNDSAAALTGISYQSFSLDKSIEPLWDQAIIKSFNRMNIPYQLL